MRGHAGSRWQGVRLRVGSIAAVALVAACGSSTIQASGTLVVGGGATGGDFAVGVAGKYQYTITTSSPMGGQAYLELFNNSDSCTEPCSAAPGTILEGSSATGEAVWEVQLPITDGASTATGTIYLASGNYTGSPNYGVSWSLTLTSS